MRDRCSRDDCVSTTIRYRQRGGNQLCVVSLTKLTSVSYYEARLLYFPYYINSTRYNANVLTEQDQVNFQTPFHDM